MAEEKKKISPKLAEFLAKINLSELPAMSCNVQELIALTHSARSATYELSKVILKDYSLTNKVLQVVNSAYYSLGRHVSSISRAVTVLGFDAVRDLAMAIALFEDFVKSGMDKEEISKLLTKAFISAVQARDCAIEKNLRVMPEEAFICSLLHNLGKTIVCAYAPDIHREIQRRITGGQHESEASEAVLGMSYEQLGEEIAKFWNLSEQIVASMEVDPERPHSSMDSLGFLRSMSDYSNRLVDAICGIGDIDSLMEKYGPLLGTDINEALEQVKTSIEASEDVSDTLRYGLTKLKMRSRLSSMEKEAGKQQGGKAEPAPAKEKPADKSEPEEAIDELPIRKDKSVNDFIHDVTETLMGPFDLNEFYVQLLEALYQGIGFDRVILSIIDTRGKAATLVARFGLGEVDTERISEIRHPLSGRGHIIPLALKTGKDMAVSGDRLSAFPENFHPMIADRSVYLFPIVVDKKPIGLIYLDRRKERPALDQSRIKTVRLFRDFAVMAIRKIAKRGR